MVGYGRSEPAEEKDVPICVSCGADNPDEARYCEDCGVELGRATTPDVHPDEVVEDETRSATQRSQEPPA
jgi:predicted amidophosphoribosyltransferase